MMETKILVRRLSQEIAAGEDRKTIEEDYFTLRRLTGQEMTSAAFIAKMRDWDMY